MDILKIRSFIEDLIYDLDTVRYLLDYGRIKETLPIIEGILGDIGSFRTDNSGNGLKDVFSEEFWNKKLPGSMTFSEMRTNVTKYSHAKSTDVEKDLVNIQYLKFVKNIFVWSERNISKIRYEIKSPFQRRTEKLLFYVVLFFIGFCILISLAWAFFTRNWGLRGEYFQGMNFEQEISSGVNKMINFSDYSQMKIGIPAEHFSVRWSGYVLAPKDGQYTFYLFLDDGGRLFIDGTQVIDEWQDHDGVEFKKKVFLTRGKHTIRLEYYNDCCVARLALYWKPEGGKKVIIPERYLRIK